MQALIEQPGASLWGLEEENTFQGLWIFAVFTSSQHSQKVSATALSLPGSSGWSHPALADRPLGLVSSQMTHTCMHK